MAKKRTRKKDPTPNLPFPNKHGGWREGAGRKKSKDSGVSHAKREDLTGRHPIHVTVSMKRGLPSARASRARKSIERAFAGGKSRFGFRLNHYSIQKDHLHLIVEADGREALSRGMQGLLVRVAKALNRAWERSGSVFRDRFHEHVLRGPREIRNALVYVLQNAHKHGLRLRAGAVDGCSSAGWFEGWRGKGMGPEAISVDTPVARPSTWLLRVGWRRFGLVRVDELPRGSCQ